MTQSCTSSAPGPGAPDLITVRGLRLIERCPVCLYAGSLVPAEVVAAAPTGARVLDTAPMTLDEIVGGDGSGASRDGKEVARVHSGDPSLYGAIAEQIRRLKALGIPYDVTPGVPAFAAAAAALGRELTIPEVSQTVILTRTAMKSSAMPEGEDLATLARSGATLVIHLSIRNLLEIERQLSPHLRRRLPGHRRLSRRLAGRDVHPRHARRHSREGARGEDHAHGADLRRPGAGRYAISAIRRSTMPATCMCCGRSGS